MGGCLSAPEDKEDYVELNPAPPARPAAPAYAPPPPRAPRDLAPPVTLNFSKSLGAEPEAASIPRFAGGGGGGGGGGSAARAGAGARQTSAVFCPCGGPGARVKLLPCGHAELCLSCAQTEAACPRCGAAIDDSMPSFRAAA